MKLQICGIDCVCHLNVYTTKQLCTAELMLSRYMVALYINWSSGPPPTWKLTNVLLCCIASVATNRKVTIWLWEAGTFYNIPWNWCKLNTIYVSVEFNTKRNTMVGSRSFFEVPNTCATSEAPWPKTNKKAERQIHMHKYWETIISLRLSHYKLITCGTDFTYFFVVHAKLSFLFTLLLDQISIFKICVCAVPC